MGIPGVSRSFPQKETGKQVYFPCLAQAPEPVPRVVGLAAGSCLRVKESSLIFSSCLDLFTGKGQLEGRSVNPHRHPSAVAAQSTGGCLAATAGLYPLDARGNPRQVVTTKEKRLGHHPWLTTTALDESLKFPPHLSFLPEPE